MTERAKQGPPSASGVFPQESFKFSRHLHPAWGFNLVRVINVATRATITDIPSPGGTGFAPRGNAITHNGAHLYVITDGLTILRSYSTVTNSFQSSQLFDFTSDGVHLIRFSVDGRRAYVTATNVPFVRTVDVNVVTGLPITVPTNINVGGVTLFLAMQPLPDTTQPVITLNGPATLTVECHTSFTDPGATALDDRNGNLTGNILVTGIVNPNVVGTYTLHYNVSDFSGNAATEVTRTVNVVDTTSPTITAPPPVTVFTGPGATVCGAVVSNLTLGTPAASDTCSSVTTSRAGVPAGNLFPVGTTMVTYKATDASGNHASATQLVKVIDNTPPTVICPPSISVEATAAGGAIVTFSALSLGDNCAGTVLSVSAPASGSVFPIGTTRVAITAGDSTGNTASCTFTVTVLGPRGIKQDVLNEMIGLRATITNKDDGEKLDETIKDLRESLLTSLWLDQTHLQPKQGEKVFGEEKDVVNELRDLLKNRKSTVSIAVLQGFINRIVRADRILAVVAINDAIAGNRRASDIAKANDELNRGDSDVAAARYESGIEHYRNAWKSATKGNERD